MKSVITVFGLEDQTEVRKVSRTLIPFVYTRNLPQTHAKRKLLIGASLPFQSSQICNLHFYVILVNLHFYSCPESSDVFMALTRQIGS